MVKIGNLSMKNNVQPANESSHFFICHIFCFRLPNTEIEDRKKIFMSKKFKSKWKIDLSIYIWYRTEVEFQIYFQFIFLNKCKAQLQT